MPLSAKKRRSQEEQVAERRSINRLFAMSQRTSISPALTCRLRNQSNSKQHNRSQLNKMQQQQPKHMEKHSGKNGKPQQPEKELQVKVALEEIDNKLMRVKVSSKNLQILVKLQILQEIKQFFPNQTYRRAKEGGIQSRARWHLPNLLWPRKQESSLVWANHL